MQHSNTESWHGIGFALHEGEAARLFRLGAAGNHSDALMEIAICYRNGSGEAMNHAVSCKKAADGDSVDCRLYLGVCYRLHLGVEKGYEEASRHSRALFCNGSGGGRLHLGHSYFRSRYCDDDKGAVRLQSNPT